MDVNEKRLDGNHVKFIAKTRNEPISSPRIMKKCQCEHSIARTKTIFFKPEPDPNRIVLVPPMNRSKLLASKYKSLQKKNSIDFLEHPEFFEEDLDKKLVRRQLIKRKRSTALLIDYYGDVFCRKDGMKIS